MTPDRCDACGRDLAGDDDALYFGEPRYVARLVPPSRRLPGGRPYQVLHPGCARDPQ
jgi:hypothetical protein